jgi:valyl-tRNA synthetase
MQGFDVLWQPGTDHAGIATEAVVAKQLASGGLKYDAPNAPAMITATARSRTLPRMMNALNSFHMGGSLPMKS